MFITTAKGVGGYLKTPVEFTLLDENKQPDRKKDEEQRSRKHVYQKPPSEHQT